MTRINLYDRQFIAKKLRELGFAVELFSNWQAQERLSHGHDILEINYLVKGEAMQEVSGITAPLESGTLSVINYGMEHTIITGAEPIDIINIYLDIERLRLPRFDEPLRGLLRSVIPLHRISAHNLNRVVILRVNEKIRFERLLFDMLKESGEERIGSRELLREYFVLFLVMLCRFAEENGLSRSITGGEEDTAMTERVLDYIDENCRNYLTLEHIAKAAGTNRHSLCRKFKLITGKTVFEHLKNRRLEAAMYELRSTDKKIIDIALDCGFVNISNFNRCFKHAIGITPTQYRARK
jgi:AraC-like DNA-binding protein